MVPAGVAVVARAAAAPAEHDAQRRRHRHRSQTPASLPVSHVLLPDRRTQRGWTGKAAPWCPRRGGTPARLTGKGLRILASSRRGADGAGGAFLKAVRFAAASPIDAAAPVPPHGASYTPPGNHAAVPATGTTH
ncbi:hypothetical protein GCM10009416_13050 [Craurococcus roseus]|uniref:Secreted protein n=1 Tax=Craurococcus roseus TaxID=77585 RepID=A0ABN1EVT5_9PROT